MSEELDYKSASKSDLWKEIKKLQKELEGKTEVPSEKQDESDLKEVNERLLSALAAERDARTRLTEVARVGVNDEVYTVENIIGGNQWIKVHDHRGVEQELVFRGKGSKHDLTASQIAELKANRSDVFDNGILYVPEVVDPSQNVIVDYDEFLSQPLDILRKSVNSITNNDVLQCLYDYIESQRWQVVGKGKESTLNEVEIPANHITVQQIIRSRLASKQELVDN